MIIYKLPDGRELPPGAAFELAGVAHPGNWLTLAGNDDLAGRGIVRETRPDPMPTLEQIRAAAMGELQASADQKHRTISQSPEQDARYLSKVEDAQLWLTRQDAPAKARLEAEAAARGVTLDALIVAVATKREALKNAAAAIEARRSAAKIAIEQASTAEQIAAALLTGTTAIAGVTS